MCKKEHEYTYHNPQAKESFITLSKGRKMPYEYYYERIFDEAKLYEDEIGKDIYSWSIDDAVNYYKQKDFRNIQSLKNLNSVFKRYTEFCFNNNISRSIENCFATMPVDVMKSCLNSRAVKKIILEKEDVLNLCNSSACTNAYMKFLIYGSFQGVILSDLVQARPQDVSKMKHVFYGASGWDYVIDDIFLAYAEETAETKEYYTEKLTMLFDDSEYIIKDKPKTRNFTTERRKMNMRNDWGRFFKKIGREDIHINSIIESGMVYYLKEHLEKTEQNIDTFFDNTADKNKFFGYWRKRAMHKKHFMLTYGYLFEDYMA